MWVKKRKQGCCSIIKRVFTILALGRHTFYKTVNWEARQDTLDNLNPENCLIVMDWAMKFLQQWSTSSQPSGDHCALWYKSRTLWLLRLQPGKDICGHNTAPTKAHIKRWLNERHDVLTAKDMKLAIKSHGSLKGCWVALVELDVHRIWSKKTKYPHQFAKEFPV